MTRAAALLLACAALVACGTARRGIPIVAEKEIRDPQVRRGQIVFHRLCNPCHPGGTQGIGVALTNKPYPDTVVEFQVRNGLGAMPAFSHEELSERDLDAVIEYIEWLRDLEPRVALEAEE